jgi:hypothetical protein
VEAIRLAVLRAGDIDARLKGASVNYPTDWSETWTPQHEAFLKKAVEEAFSGEARRP